MTNETKKVIEGFNKVANIIAKTAGAKGRNIIIKPKNQPARISNDGAYIAKAINFDDCYENIGAELVKQVSIQTSIIAGDGTSTATILANAILQAGIKLDIDIQTMKKLVSAGEEICSWIDSKAKKIKTFDEIKQVALVSLEDEELATLFAEMFVDEHTVIDVETSETKNTYYELFNGFSIENGYIARQMVNEGNKAVMKDTPVLVTDKKIESVEQILPIYKKLSSIGINNLTIFCGGMSDPVVEVILANQRNGVFSTLVVEIPSLFREDTANDLAVLTGATMIGKGMTLQQITDKELGFAKKVTSDFFITKISVEPSDDEHVIGNYISKLKELPKTPETEKRIAKLKQGIVTLYVGASTLGELGYKKDKIEDGIHAVKCALEEGVVAGGGVTLRDYFIENPNKEGKEWDILRESLSKPYETILSNAGIHSIETKMVPGEGFDVKDGVQCNLMEKGIVDPAKVTKTALRNAISLASTILTTEDVVIEK